MGNTGYDNPFAIWRKRNVYSIPFLVYLHGRDSAVAEWEDRDEREIDPTVTDAQLAPYGYLMSGAEFLSGNLDVDGETITEFTIALVVARNQFINNEGAVYGLFGSTHYPRIYFATSVLHAEIELDGTPIEVTVSGLANYLKTGQPGLIVFRGKASTGIEVLIDGVSLGTDNTTGTSYDVGAGDFKIGKDVDLSYFQKGAVRGVFVTDAYMTDGQLLAWRSMLEYEGFFDIWRDNFQKWTGSNTFFGGTNVIGGSPYVATIVEPD